MNRIASSHEKSLACWDVIESLRLGLVVTSSEGAITDLNGAACRMLHVDRDRCIGMPAARALPRGGVVQAVIEETLRDRRAVADRIGSPLGENEPCTVRCRSTILRDPSGEMTGTACEIEDVSDLANMEEEVKHLDRLAMMGRFASSIAHEIRNPLTGIYAGVQYLKKTLDLPTDKEQITFTIISDEVERLNRIVTDLLGAARPPELECRTVDPNEIVHKVAPLAREEAAQKEVELELLCDGSLPPIALDSDLVLQVLHNLVRNAIEASPAGGKIIIETGLSATSPQLGILPSSCLPPSMEFRVIDEGPGVPAGKEELIFEPFQSTKKRGTGLGLYISFQIVKRHGGGLWVTNDEGKGASFVARFPYRQPESQ